MNGLGLTCNYQLNVINGLITINMDVQSAISTRYPTKLFVEKLLHNLALPQLTNRIESTEV